MSGSVLVCFPTHCGILHQMFFCIKNKLILMSILKQLLKDVLTEEFRKACGNVTVDWISLSQACYWCSQWLTI